MNNIYNFLHSFVEAIYPSSFVTHANSKNNYIINGDSIVSSKTEVKDINTLPDELLAEILKHLPTQDLMKAKEINKRFYWVIESHSDIIGQESHCNFIASKIIQLNLYLS